MRNRPKSQPVDPKPVMPRGATEFEEKRIACDFQLVFTRISQVGWTEFIEPYEYAYRAGFIAGKSKLEMDQSKISKLPTYIKIL